MNIAISVVPFLDIPAHTCTESGCFGLGFGMEGSLIRLNCFAKNLSHRTVLSSVNIVVKLYFCSAKEESFFFVLGAYHLTVACTRLDPAHSLSLSVDQTDGNVKCL